MLVAPSVPTKKVARLASGYKSFSSLHWKTYGCSAASPHLTGDPFPIFTHSCR